MSDHATVQAALLTVIQLLETWSDENSISYDWRIMDKGLNEWVILYPGASPSLAMGAGASMRNWIVVADLGYRVGGDLVEAWEKFTDNRDELIQHIEKYPSLNGTANVEAVRVDAPADPIELPVDIASNKTTVGAIWQELRITVTVDYAITGGEY